MNKKTKIGLFTSALVGVLALTAALNVNKGKDLAEAEENYQIILNADNTPTIIENNALEVVSRHVEMVYQNVSEAEDAHVALLPGGIIANNGQDYHYFSGVKSISVVTDGEINLYGQNPKAGSLDLLHTFTAETPIFDKAINYGNLMFVNADITFNAGDEYPSVVEHENTAKVVSATIEYSCVDTRFVSLSGKIVSAAGFVSGATVSIPGTNLTAVSGADGEYVFENVFVPTFEFELVAECDTYFATRVTVNSLTTVQNLELIKHPYSSGNFISADHKAVPFFTRSTSGLIFDIQDLAGLTADREYSIFITLNGNVDTNRAGSYVLEFRFNTNNWIGVWNYKTATWVTWTPDVALSYNADKTSARVTITYSYINGIEGYSIAPQDRVGVTFGAWVTTTLTWEGWKEGGWYADPLNPSVYLKVDANNVEYVNW